MSVGVGVGGGWSVGGGGGIDLVVLRGEVTPADHPSPVLLPARPHARQEGLDSPPDEGRKEGEKSK